MRGTHDIKVVSPINVAIVVKWIVLTPASHR